MNGKWEAVVDGLLKANVEEADLVAPRRWRVTLCSNGADHVGDARLEDDWLVIEAPADASGRSGPWELLRRNSRLDGLGKFALVSRERTPRLVAEILLEEEIDLPGVLNSTLDGLVHELGGAGHPRGVPAPAPKSVSSKELAGMCAAYGWPATEKKNSCVAVELPTSRGVYSAVASGGNGHGARVSVLLASCGSLKGPRRRALALLLLTACGAFRHARAAIHNEGDEPLACFEVRLSRSPVAAELDHALSALTVACDLCGPEAQAIENRAAAGRYLKMRG